MIDNPVPFGKTAEEIIKDTIADYNYPVVFGFPAGHIVDNRTLIAGGTTELVVAGDSKLIFTD